MPDTNSFRELFANWPASLPRRGVVVSTLNEATPFKGFMLKADMIVLERQNPDTMGSRFILMPFEGISAVKLIDPLKAEAFAPLGFEGQFSQ
ncbi:MAG: hypothetical protein AAF711_19575 [Planctomycetota bacterium]